MGLQGMPGPDRTYLAGGVITNGDDKIDGRRIRLREFVPGFAPQSCRRELHLLEELQGNRMDGALGMAAGTETADLTLPPVIRQALSQDAAGRVARAEEENIVGSAHQEARFLRDTTAGRQLRPPQQFSVRNPTKAFICS